jgi:hypothetical protein
MRYAVLLALTEEWQTTNQVAAGVKMTTRVVKRILDELVAVGICERHARDDKRKDTGGGVFKEADNDRRSDSYRIVPEYRSTFIEIERCDSIRHIPDIQEEVTPLCGFHRSIFGSSPQAERKSSVCTATKKAAVAPATSKECPVDNTSSQENAL